MLKTMMDKLFKCKDVDLIGKLNDALPCTWELMQEYTNSKINTGLFLTVASMTLDLYLWI